ncbi:hypothetical protein ARTHRO9V_160416 [Arthrobacter sp. 9V]|nr:hypothetical protein ARTHRO9V_160416 [Arthrobacter sp. 9V]
MPRRPARRLAEVLGRHARDALQRSFVLLNCGYLFGLTGIVVLID